jgi:hypothetical protein
MIRQKRKRVQEQECNKRNIPNAGLLEEMLAE